MSMFHKIYVLNFLDFDGLLSFANRSETSQPPHFALPGSLEYDFGMRWRRVFEEHQIRTRQVEDDFRNQIEHLEREMETSVDDIEVNKIKASK